MCIYIYSFYSPFKAFAASINAVCLVKKCISSLKVVAFGGGLKPVFSPLGNHTDTYKNRRSQKITFFVLITQTDVETYIVGGSISARFSDNVCVNQ